MTIPRPVDLPYLPAHPPDAEIGFGILSPRRREQFVIFDINIAAASRRHCWAGNVTFTPVALADTEGERDLHVSSGLHPGAGTAEDFCKKSDSLPAWRHPEPLHGRTGLNQTVRFKTRTLDHFHAPENPERIDVIHTEVRRAEMLGFRGAGRRPHIAPGWLEVLSKQHYHGQSLGERVHAFMRAAGFERVLANNFDARSGEDDRLFPNTRTPRNWRYFLRSLPRQFVGLVWRAVFGPS